MRPVESSEEICNLNQFTASVQSTNESKSSPSSSDSEIKKFCYNLANCQVLSANLNNLKSDKKINDESLEVAVKVEMKKYSGINDEKYDEYSDVLNSEKLVRERGGEIINQFKTSRREINRI